MFLSGLDLAQGASQCATDRAQSRTPEQSLRMTSRAIRGLRKRSSVKPLSPGSAPELRHAYRSWEYLSGLYRDWVHRKERGWPVSPEPPVHVPWVESFDAFLADMGKRPHAHVISRPNPQKPFAPGNCCYVPRPNAGKRGPAPRVLITHDGQTLPVREWADRLRIPAITIYCRVKRGLTGAAALGIKQEVAS